MKTLLIVRHAKSDWNNEDLSDFDRPLNARGRRNAPDMGKRIKKHALIPDLIWSSGALRARHTAELIAKEIGYPEESIVYDDHLYHAGHNSLLEQIKQQDDQHRFLMLVGHNPGLTYLASSLGSITIDNIPTAGVALLNFRMNSWSEIAFGKGNLEWYDYPKSKNNG